MSSNYILVTLKNFHSRLKMKTNTRIWEIVYNFVHLFDVVYLYCHEVLTDNSIEYLYSVLWLLH